MKLNLEKQNFRLFGPDETASNRLEAVYEVSGKVWMADIEDVDIGEDPAPIEEDDAFLEEEEEEGNVSGILGGKGGDEEDT